MRGNFYKFSLILLCIVAVQPTLAKCVAKEMDEAPTDTERYLEKYDNSFLKCGGKDDPYYTCSNGTVVAGKDDNLYRCGNDNKWVKLGEDEIQDCGNDLAAIATKYGGDFQSIKGDIDSDNPTGYVYFWEGDDQAGFNAMSDYCKYPAAKYKAQLEACGNPDKFLTDTDENDNYILCSTGTEQALDDNCDLSWYNEALKKCSNCARLISDDKGQELCGYTLTDIKSYTDDTAGNYTNFSFINAKEEQANFNIQNCLCNVEDNVEEIVVEEDVNNSNSDGEESNLDNSLTAIGTQFGNNVGIESIKDKAKDLIDKNKSDEKAKANLKNAQDKLDAAKDKEQSLANRTLTAASTAATGLGMMTAASARAEQKADEAAERDMRAYLETLHCSYANKQVKYSPEEIVMPGGNELLGYYTEYKALAEKLKKVKAALNLRPGIESQVLYDRAESGLYQNTSIGKTGGAYTSLARALSDPESADAAAWTEQKDTTKKKLVGGAIAAGAGIIGGAIGNIVINGKDDTSGTDWGTDSDDDEDDDCDENGVCMGEASAGDDDREDNPTRREQKKECKEAGNTWRKGECLTAAQVAAAEAAEKSENERM